MPYRAFLAAALASSSLALSAQTPPPVAPQKATTALDAPAAPAAEKSIDDLTKDFQKIPGILTFYRQKKAGSDQIWLEIPESSLEKLMLLQATAATGLGGTSVFHFHGEPLSDTPFRFRRVDENRIALMAPNLGFRSTQLETQRTIARSFPETQLASLEIKARQESRKSVLIDVSGFFKSDISELSALLDDGQGGGYALSTDQSYVDSLKNFPENAVIRTVYTLVRKNPTQVTVPRTVPWAISYMISALPETDYRPRFGDPRVGYFTTDFENLDDQSSIDPNTTYIQRWNLKKADPKAAMSPPVKPITFWIDNAVPIQYRDSVRYGLLMYNRAFEKLGIKNAIVVKQMPNDADWDIADIRYNVIRWTTGMPFAISLFRANPMTGEILNACINMDGGFASSGTSEFEAIFDPAKFGPQQLRGAKFDPRRCTYQHDGADQFRFGDVALRELGGLGPAYDRETYIKQYIIEVVGHEFGHLLGLRHNFAASTEFTMDQLADPKLVKSKGIGASIMDYNAFNISALKKKNVDVYSQVIGTYDYWAIEYGYRQTQAKTTQGEVPELRKIASKSGLPGLRYESDGSVNDFDPTVATFDMSSDPMAYFTRSLQVSRYLLQNLGKRKPTAGKSYFDFTRSYNWALRYYFNAAARMPVYLGGMILGNSYRGDKGERKPLTPIDAAKQKSALNLLNTYVFSPDAFNFPKEDLLKLTFNPSQPGNEGGTAQREFPMRSNFESFGRAALNSVFSPTVLRRVSENEYRTPAGGKALSVATLIRSVDANVWSELASGREVTDLRRQLQRDSLSVLIGLATSRSTVLPGDARAVATSELRSLKTRLAKRLPSAKGEYQAAHYAECYDRINRSLSAISVVGP